MELAIFLFLKSSSIDATRQDFPVLIPPDTNNSREDDLEAESDDNLSHSS